MINRLFTLRSDREQAVEKVTPIAPSSSNTWGDKFDADFFAGSVREDVLPQLENHDTQPKKLRGIILPLVGATALAATLYFGVRAELNADNRKEDVEACVEGEIGVNVELKIDPATGEIIRPEKIYSDIVECEAIVAGN